MTRPRLVHCAGLDRSHMFWPSNSTCHIVMSNPVDTDASQIFNRRPAKMHESRLDWENAGLDVNLLHFASFPNHHPQICSFCPTSHPRHRLLCSAITIGTDHYIQLSSWSSRLAVALLESCYHLPPTHTPCSQRCLNSFQAFNNDDCIDRTTRLATCMRFVHGPPNAGHCEESGSSELPTHWVFLPLGDAASPRHSLSPPLKAFGSPIWRRGTSDKPDRPGRR